MTAHLTHDSKYYSAKSVATCIHLHGIIVTVRAGVENGKNIGDKMDRFVVHFDLFALASVEGGQHQGQTGSKQGDGDKCENELSANGHATRECPAK